MKGYPVFELTLDKELGLDSSEELERRFHLWKEITGARSSGARILYNEFKKWRDGKQQQLLLVEALTFVAFSVVPFRRDGINSRLILKL